jgi:hypothetical protein
MSNLVLRGPFVKLPASPRSHLTTIGSSSPLHCSPRLSKTNYSLDRRSVSPRPSGERLARS